MIQLKFPGKLFLTGEYAIMAPNTQAVVAAVNRYVEVSVTEATTHSIVSRFGSLEETTMFSLEGPMRYVSAALSVAHEYSGHHEPYHLRIDSELDHDNEKKYGFGSSGVVIVAVIAGVLSYYEIPYTKEVLFKLSVCAQYRLNELSSGGDLAAAVYGGIIAYSRYDLRVLNDDPIKDLVHKKWPHLEIKSLSTNAYDLYIGWTQNENKTTPYVDTFRAWANEQSQDYKAWMTRSQEAVALFIAGWENHDDRTLFESIQTYRNLMLELGKTLMINIETKELTHLIDDAHELGFIGKISGSGGGDCGYVIASEKKPENIVKLHKQWAKNGILFLDVEVDK